LVAAAVATVVLLSLAVAAEVAYRPNRSTAAQQSSAAGSTSAAPPGTTGPQGAPTTAPTSASPTRFVLPANFLWWTDKTGYQVAWPANWSRQREAPTVMFFCAPGGPPTLRVRVWNDAGPDLLAALRREEQASALPRYEQIRIEALADAPNRDTVWEYEFTDPKAGRLRGLDHAFVAGGRTYVIQWRTPPAKWVAAQKDLQVVMNSFRPAAQA
jgi:hypothetical protein